MNQIFLYYCSKWWPAVRKIDFASDWLSSKCTKSFLHKIGFKFWYEYSNHHLLDKWRFSPVSLQSADRRISSDALNIIANINTAAKREKRGVVQFCQWCWFFPQSLCIDQRPKTKKLCFNLSRGHCSGPHSIEFYVFQCVELFSESWLNFFYCFFFLLNLFDS